MPTETEIANIALGKIGGAGDQVSGTGIIADINGTDRVSARCKLLLPRARRRTFEALVKSKTPPKEALVFTDLGAQGETTLKMGGWDYVFNLPGDTIRNGVVRQIDEKFKTVQSSITNVITEYPFQIRWQGSTMKFFTNTLSNTAGDSAFIDRVFDQKNPNTWTEALLDAIATLLASELCPTVGAIDKERIRLLAEYDTVALSKAKSVIQSADDAFKRIIKSNYKGGRSESLPTV